MPCARRASSPNGMVGLLPVVATARPSSRSISPSSTPSARAASAMICLRTASPASCAEQPAFTAWRLAKAPTPLGDGAGIADRHHDVLDAAADLFGDDLRQRGAGALALIGGAGGDCDLAARQDPHGDALERAEPGAFDVIADADADQPALLERRALPLAEAFIAGKRATLRPVPSDNRRCHRPAACRRGTAARLRRASVPAG